ncbi:MAG TPA: hypothetical protein VKR56_12385 [Candidatus Cybelea sp.]|nr:hypothetical protein [Candidatus Cybelea sp.]
MYRTSLNKAAAVLLAASVFPTAAGATTFVTSQTYKAGTRIACVLDQRVDSSKLAYGDKFKLRIVDPAHPALNGSEIIGYITDVRQPSGMDRARVGFYLTSIKLSNGQKKSISAYVVSKRVVPINPVAQSASRQQLSPMAGVPYGTVTPGPIAWQARIGAGGTTISTSDSPNLGGYVYAMGPHEAIVVPAGQPVTVELSANLTIP